MDNREEQAKRAAAMLNKSYGHKTGSTASEEWELNVIPTGSLALDYALRIGGWPRGQLIEVFGPPDIGKSSALGLQAIVQAQKLGLLCGYIAVEPNVDKKWIVKNGVNSDQLVIARPDNGQIAFEILNDWVTGRSTEGTPVIDFVLLDSLGAILRPNEAESGIPSQMGQASLITTGTKAAIMPAFKNNITVMLLNQIRDDPSKKFVGAVKTPGGHGKEHNSPLRVQLKPGKDRFSVKDDGDDVLIGREIKATIIRTKFDEGTNRTASFDFYQKEVEGFPFGIDTTKDILNTAMRAKVIENAGAYYRHRVFPKVKNGNHQVMGKDGVAEFFAENPDTVEEIRKDVLEVMFKVAIQEEKDRKERLGRKAEREKKK